MTMGRGEQIEEKSDAENKTMNIEATQQLKGKTTVSGSDKRLHNIDLKRRVKGQAPATDSHKSSRAFDVNIKKSESRDEEIKKTESLSGDPEEKIEELQRKQKQVRRRNRARTRVAAQYIQGGPTYTYKKGPNGEMYAVSGDVRYDTTTEQDPKKTIEKMKAIRKAIQSIPEPTLEDKRVANEAAKKLKEARQKLDKKQQKKQKSESTSKVSDALMQASSIDGGYDQIRRMV